MANTWKRILATSLIFVLTVYILAACSNSNNNNSGNDSSSGTESANESTDSTESEQTAKAPEDYNGTIEFWGWDAEGLVAKLIPEFNKVYPNIKVEATQVAQGDMNQKIKTTLASGGKLPDIFEMEVTWKGDFLQLDILEDLEQQPYNYDRSKMVDYVNLSNQNTEGKVVGVETTLTPAAIAYKRDLAKQYFGTDDPKELAAQFSSMEDFITKGKEVLQKSNNSVYMFSGLADVNIIITQQKQIPLTDDDGVIQATNKAKNNLELLAAFRDAGVVDKLDQWTPPWYASYAAKNHIFYPAANWSGPYIIAPNDKDSTNWGLMVPPGGAFSWGGTIMGIPKESDNKELAWKFIEFSLLSKDTINILKEFGYYPSFKAAYDDQSVFAEESTLFGGQDIGNFWTQEAVPQINFDGLKYTAFDLQYSEVVNAALQSLIADKSMTADMALENLIKELKAKLPDNEVK